MDFSMSVNSNITNKYADFVTGVTGGQTYFHIYDSETDQR